MTPDDRGSMAEYYSDPADDPTPTGELTVWPPAPRQIALECAARVNMGKLDAADRTVEYAKRFEQYLTTGT